MGRVVLNCTVDFMEFLAMIEDQTNLIPLLSLPCLNYLYVIHLTLELGSIFRLHSLACALKRKQEYAHHKSVVFTIAIMLLYTHISLP